ncbi:MAG TPA: transcriptional regulator NrdR [Pirellulales bacterium]|nr:transcriptional regulator NrdR [Pirellulales bacterium]
MQCPYCRIDNDKVIDSRASDEGFAIRRRRECLGCKRRFTTYERVEEPAIKVVKKDGIRAPFEREKIKQGLMKACWKRPVSDEQIEAIVAEVESDVYANFDTEVSTRYLGELVMKHLRALDQVAFVRFASVYREFKDVRDFVEELQPILAERRSGRATDRGEG